MYTENIIINGDFNDKLDNWFCSDMYYVKVYEGVPTGNNADIAETNTPTILSQTTIEFSPGYWTTRNTTDITLNKIN